MANAKRNYDVAFKHEVLRLLEVSGKRTREIEEELGIRPGLLGKWRQRYRFETGGSTIRASQQQELELENRRLRRELKQVKAERELLKNDTLVCRGSVVKRYQAVAEAREHLGLRRACQLLGVSVSGYYAWRQRRATGVAPAESCAEVLIEPIRTIFQQSRRTYGSRRIGAALRQQDWVCSRKRIVKIMRQEGLTARRGRRRRPATRPIFAPARVAINHLQRIFHGVAPSSVWLVDLPFIATREGWLYLASVLDLCSRRIVGWTMAAHCTSALVLQALRMALAQRQAQQLHHSDRGSQYTNRAYQQQLVAQGITVSMSRSADPYDNAVMESWIATLKTECIEQVYRQAAQ